MTGKNTEQTIRRIVREELTDRGGSTRRDVLKGAGLVGLASLAGAGSASAQTSSGTTASLAQVSPGVYQVSEGLYRGSDAGKSNVSPETQRMYWADDTQIVYYGDGNSWTQFADLSAIGTGGGSGSGVFASYEIVDDGTNGETTISAAISNLPSNGGVVEIAPSYANSDTLPISVGKPVKFLGHGWGTGTGGNSIGLDFSGNTADTVFDVDVGIEQPRHSIQFHDLRIEGGDIGINLGSGGFYRVERCWIQDQATNNVAFDGGGGGLYTYMQHCFFEDAGGTAVDMSAPTPGSSGSMPHNSQFYACHFNGAADYGLNLNGFQVVADACGFEGAGLSGARFTNSSSNGSAIINSYFEANGQDNTGDADDSHIRIQDGGTNTTKRIINNYMSGAGAPARGIDTRYTENVVIAFNAGQSASVFIGPSTEHAWIGWVDPRSDGNPDGQPDISVDATANYIRRHGLGQESANAEEPTASEWQAGEIVEFTDSGDGSGDGLYMKLFDGTFTAI
jgi:hypothetical protein